MTILAPENWQEHELQQEPRLTFTYPNCKTLFYSSRVISTLTLGHTRDLTWLTSVRALLGTRRTIFFSFNAFCFARR
jgi:hypothetical protein